MPNNAASRGYAKIIEWSNEDQCYVGRVPGLFHGGCHGDDELQVFLELCEIVDEVIEIYQEGNLLTPGMDQHA